MRLMIACPVTDEPVPTGIETEQEWRTRFPGVPSTLDPCPACGGAHTWLPTSAWIEDEWRFHMVDAA
jgi:hypothetical protein